jgi:hypothetical protein
LQAFSFPCLLKVLSLVVNLNPALINTVHHVVTLAEGPYMTRHKEAHYSQVLTPSITACMQRHLPAGDSLSKESEPLLQYIPVSTLCAKVVVPGAIPWDRAYHPRVLGLTKGRSTALPINLQLGSATLWASPATETFLSSAAEDLQRYCNQQACKGHLTRKGILRLSLEEPRKRLGCAHGLQKHCNRSRSRSFSEPGTFL